MIEVTLLLLSFMGYFLLLYVLLQGRKVALYPAITVSAITTVGYLAGLVGALAHGFSFIFFGGLVLIPACGIYMLQRPDKVAIPPWHSIIPMGCFFLGCALLYFSLNGRFLNQYDDFTHWARVARLLSQELHFPKSTDMISFASYPLGSGVFIAYVSYIIGSAEDIWMFSQAVMLLSLWLPLLAASRKVVIQLLLGALLFPLMNYCIPLESLYVDTLLGASAFAAFVLVMKGVRDSDRYLLPFALSLSTLALIKNSGVFLALILAVYCVYLYRKERGTYSWRLLVIFVPFVMLAMWNAYVDHYFVMESKHQISADYYQAILAGKTAEDIRQIFHIILPVMLNPLENQALLLLPGYFLILLVYHKRKILSGKKHLLVFASVIFVAYELGIMAMYVLSMPMKEFLIQRSNDYGRYNSTITVFLAALLLYCGSSLRFPKREKQKAESMLLQLAVMGITMVLTCYTLSFKLAKVSTLSYRITKSQTPYQFSLIQEELQAIPDGSECIVLFDAEDRFVGYNENVARYYLRTEEIVCCQDEASALQKRASMPWKYYIDLAEGCIEAPTETVGIELKTRTESFAFVNVLDHCGYMENTRYSLTTGKEITAYDWDVTGYIPVRKGDVVRLQNVNWYVTDENHGRGGVCWFTADKSFYGNMQFVPGEKLSNWKLVVDDKNNIIQFTVPSGVGSSTAYMRIICQDINNTSVITVNEEIQ